MNHSRLGVGRELIDPHWFKNARQVGNYLDFFRARARAMGDDAWVRSPNNGNPRLRRLMVELAWRLSRCQPRYPSGASGRRSLRIPKPRRRSARKLSSPSPVVWPLTSGALLPVACSPKNSS